MTTLAQMLTRCRVRHLMGVMYYDKTGLLIGESITDTARYFWNVRHNNWCLAAHAAYRIVVWSK